VIVYVSGRFCPLAEASVPLGDRGLLFGDGVYEMYRLYGGRPFRLKEHVERLYRSAQAIRLELPPLDWSAIHAELVERNGLAGADATVYIQVTRGAPSGRGHAFPPSGTPPTVFAIARPFAPPAAGLYEAGAAVITRPDVRWGRCDIKSTNLLPNVLANQEAAEAGAWETVFVRDGIVTEGSHTNVFVVLDGRLATHPEGPRILSGVTRSAVLELAREEGVPVDERPVLRAALDRASEVFLTGTSAEVMPVVRIDGAPVGGGAPGPIARRLRAAFPRLR
jgi:D-alanine transaminase